MYLEFHQNICVCRFDYLGETVQVLKNNPETANSVNKSALLSLHSLLQNAFQFQGTFRPCFETEHGPFLASPECLISFSLAQTYPTNPKSHHQAIISTLTNQSKPVYSQSDHIFGI